MIAPGKLALVTGASGYLASCIIPALKQNGCQVVGVERENLGDISFWTASLPGADFVFHLAAQTSAYQADAEPLGDWKANVQPMLAILEACRATKSHPLVLFAGSCTQFGLPDRLPVDETQADHPATIYDRHKIAAEAYLQHYAKLGWARGVTLRLANVYGPGPVSGSADRGILNLMMRKALKGEDMPLYGHGAQIRDYVFIKDVASAFMAAARHPDAVNGRHFVLASGKGHSLSEAFTLVAERAAMLTGRRPSIVNVTPPSTQSPIEARNFVGDATALSAATGWSCAYGLTAGVDATLKYFQKAA